MGLQGCGVLIEFEDSIPLQCDGAELLQPAVCDIETVVNRTLLTRYSKHIRTLQFQGYCKPSQLRRMAVDRALTTVFADVVHLTLVYKVTGWFERHGCRVESRSSMKEIKQAVEPGWVREEAVMEMNRECEALQLDQSPRKIEISLKLIVSTFESVHRSGWGEEGEDEDYRECQRMVS